MFSVSDVQRLVEFSPPYQHSAVGKRPAHLVPSITGDGFVKANVVEKRFQESVQNSPRPISTNDLPAILGVQYTNWSTGDDLNYHADGVLTQPMERSILDTFEDSVKAHFVALGPFTAKHGISIRTSKELSHKNTESESQTIVSDPPTKETQMYPGDSYACSRELWKRINEEIMQVMRDAGIEPLDLNAVFPSTPAFVLRQMVREQMKMLGGDLEDDEYRLWYSSPAASEHKNTSEKQKRQEMIDSCLAKVQDGGYCIVPTKTAFEVIDHCKQQSTENEVIHLDCPSNEDNMLLATHSFIASRQHVSADKARDYASHLWSQRANGDDMPPYDDPKVQAALITNDQPADPFILSSSYSREIEDSYTAKIRQHQDSLTLALSTLLKSSLQVPERLYTAGLETITDASLRPRLEEFLHTHLKDISKTTLAELETKKLIGSKAVLREVTKFSSAVTEARTLKETQTAIAKSSRKLKVDAVSDAELHAAKLEILAQKVTASQRMKRGSDVLQNVVWISSASRREGSYVSSGKDTSRMVKSCRATEGADMEVVGRVERFRDAVKEGKETEGMREDMKMTAGAAVEQLRSGSG